LKTKLEERNYPLCLIEEKFDKAKSKDRRSLIFQKKKKNLKDVKIRLMFTHNNSNPPIHQWIRDGRKQLLRNEQAKDIGRRIQIGSKQPKNLQRIVGGYSDSDRMETPTQNPGCFKYKKCKVVCPVLTESKSFQSENTKKTYKIRQKLTCESDWLIYLATCKNVVASTWGSPKPFLS
jgi:hypothetical protein